MKLRHLEELKGLQVYEAIVQTSVLFTYACHRVMLSVRDRTIKSTSSMAI